MIYFLAQQVIEDSGGIVSDAAKNATLFIRNTLLKYFPWIFDTASETIGDKK